MRSGRVSLNLAAREATADLSYGEGVLATEAYQLDRWGRPAADPKIDMLLDPT